MIKIKKVIYKCRYLGFFGENKWKLTKFELNFNSNLLQEVYSNIWLFLIKQLKVFIRSKKKKKDDTKVYEVEVYQKAAKTQSQLNLIWSLQLYPWWNEDTHRLPVQINKRSSDKTLQEKAFKHIGRKDSPSRPIQWEICCVDRKWGPWNDQTFSAKE